MIVCKLTVSYDRGVARNDERIIKDQLGLQEKAEVESGDARKDDRLIRGLGTHYRSAADAEVVALRDKDARRVYQEFRARFLSTTVDGLYVVPAPGVAKAFLSGLSYRSDIQVRVTEFELAAIGAGLGDTELSEWASRIRRQLGSISLGRSKEADEEGLRALETLARCPVLKPETAASIQNLIGLVRAEKLGRVELKRKIETLDVQIDTAPLAPRRAPAMAALVAFALLGLNTLASAHGHAHVHLDGHEAELFTQTHHLFWFVVGAGVGIFGERLNRGAYSESPAVGEEAR